MKRSRFIVLVSALSLAGLGVACGGGDGGDNEGAADNAPTGSTATTGAVGGGDAITVTAKEFSFEPKELKLQAGKAAKIVLKNTGAVEHDITIENPAFKVAAPPTKSGEGAVTMPAAGSYTYYCSVPGHRQAGMEGPVTVS